MLLSGDELRVVFAWQNPLKPGGPGTPAPRDRVTVLAVNANFPLELSIKAFCQAAATGEGSPLIVQFSHNALRGAGGRDHAATASAAFHAGLMLEHYVEVSGAPLVASALDHFRVPPYPAAAGHEPSRAVRLARAAVEDAAEASRSVLPAVPERELEAYVGYLSSPSYFEFRREFAAVLEALDPAWAMVDTERLPPILNFAVTRDMVDLVRRDLGLTGVMVEAEYGATGVTGESVPYLPLNGGDLEAFADEVASFVSYTGADGISYPIGMEHSAPFGRRHEPDQVRLEVVQRRLAGVAGRYIPFAQHGGTGAAHLALGLVGKNNVNTHFLAVGANALLAQMEAENACIKAGVKESCGPRLYGVVVEAIAEATTLKLKEAGTLDTAPALEVLLRSAGETDR